MLGVTLFGLFLTPVFYVLLRTLAKRFEKEPVPAVAHTATKPEGVA
jgi:multidrug efflux pump